MRPVDVVAGRPGQQRVVDVGDVLDVAHLVPGVTQGPQQDVERHIGRRVADVGCVVRGDAAHVHARDRAPLEVDQGGGGGVVDVDREPLAGHGGDEGRRPGDHCQSVSGRFAVTAQATG